MPLPHRNFVWFKMKQHYEELNSKGSDDVVNQTISNMKAAGGIYDRSQSNKK
jgi:hypothetical protein